MPYRKGKVANRLEDPICVYGGGLTCAEWLDWLWGITRPADGCSPAGFDVIDEVVDPLAKYVCARTFERWALLADVDIEEGLQELIDEALSNGIRDRALEIRRNGANERFHVFEAEAMLDDWVAYAAARAVSSPLLADSGYGNPIVWMCGERPEKPRPEFKESAFAELVRAWKSEVFPVLGAVAEAGAETSFCDMGQFLAPDPDPGSAMWFSSELGELLSYGPRACAVIVDRSYVDYGESVAWEIADMLALMGALPDGADVVAAIGLSTEMGIADAFAELASAAGLDVVYDGTGTLPARIPSDRFHMPRVLGLDSVSYAGELGPGAREVVASVLEAVLAEELCSEAYDTIYGALARTEVPRGELLQVAVRELTCGTVDACELALPTCGDDGIVAACHLAGLEPGFYCWNGTERARLLSAAREIWARGVPFSGRYRMPDRGPGSADEFADALRRVSDDIGLAGCIGAVVEGVPAEDVMPLSRASRS